MERFPFIELQNRTCDALALAYEPKGRIFYIPPSEKVQIDLGNALRKLFGTSPPPLYLQRDWAELRRVNNFQNIQPRIWEGINNSLRREGADDNFFELGYIMCNPSLVMDFDYAFGRGHVYCFGKGKRELALRDFSLYWAAEERHQWQRIQAQMRIASKKK
jgi:hypothetical protein